MRGITLLRSGGDNSLLGVKAPAPLVSSNTTRRLKPGEREGSGPAGLFSAQAEIIPNTS